MKHGRRTKFISQDDGTIVIKTESYHDQLASETEELMQHIKTSKQDFMADLISVASVITSQKTRHLTIEIETDSHYQPIRITKTYLVKKENYNKR